MRYNINRFFICRFIMLIIYALEAYMSFYIAMIAVKDLRKYGPNNPSQFVSLAISMAIFVLIIYSILEQIIRLEKESLYKTTITFCILVSVYITNPIFENYVAKEHNKMFLDEKMMETTFTNYRYASFVKAMLVQRTQVDGECCGYKDKNLWHDLGYEKAKVSAETIYPVQCCIKTINKCSEEHIFKKGCKFLSEAKLNKLRKLINNRVIYKHSMMWVILLIIHGVVAFVYHDLLTGHFFNSISGL